MFVTYIIFPKVPSLLDAELRNAELTLLNASLPGVGLTRGRAD